MDGVTTGGFAGGVVPQVPVYLGGDTSPQVPRATSKWSYEEAFKRNRGLITDEEQEKLRNSRVAIAGMGGVGGVHLITLARLGIGKFTIADPDVFEVANFNRQYGATISNLGRNKAEAMAEAALDINPELELRVFPRAIDASNVDDFLRDADLFVDGLDFFAIDARRLLFRRAAERELWAITAGPISFSTAWLAFDPAGMKFDAYFDVHNEIEQIDLLAAFAVGLTPKATQVPYTDLSHANLTVGTGPCASIGCELAAGVIGTEALKILLKRGKVSAAPDYLQFDAYRNRFVTGRLRFGNRSPIQRLKRRVLKNRFIGTREVDRSEQPPGIVERFKAQLHALPPIHRYIPLIIGQTLSRQTLERTPEPHTITNQIDNVMQYDQVMTTKLAIAYAIALEIIYQARQVPFGGSALDLACGPGHYSLCMAKYLKLDNLLGIDLSDPMITIATENARLQGQSTCLFRTGDVTNLEQFDDSAFDLSTFTDAAHHMPDLTTVAKVIGEMDRVTKPGGTVFIMDLVRLKTGSLTEKYVDVVGSNYCDRGLNAFLTDFRNSMYAAWTDREFVSALPSKSRRRWYHLVPAGLPTIQLLIGAPLDQPRGKLRNGFPWTKTENPLMKSLRTEWSLLRRTLRIQREL